MYANDRGRVKYSVGSAISIDINLEMGLLCLYFFLAYMHHINGAGSFNCQWLSVYSFVIKYFIHSDFFFLFGFDLKPSEKQMSPEFSTTYSNSSDNSPDLHPIPHPTQPHFRLLVLIISVFFIAKVS